jgi:hypothetical protein
MERCFCSSIIFLFFSLREKQLTIYLFFTRGACGRVYRAPPINFWIFRRENTVPEVGLPGCEVVIHSVQPVKRKISRIVFTVKK